MLQSPFTDKNGRALFEGDTVLCDSYGEGKHPWTVTHDAVVGDWLLSDKVVIQSGSNLTKI